MLTPESTTETTIGSPATPVTLTVYEGDRGRFASLRTSDSGYNVYVELDGDTMDAVHVSALGWHWLEAPTLAALARAGVTVPDGVTYLVGRSS